MPQNIKTTELAMRLKINWNKYIYIILAIFTLALAHEFAGLQETALALDLYEQESSTAESIEESLEIDQCFSADFNQGLDHKNIGSKAFIKLRNIKLPLVLINRHYPPPNKG